MEQFKNLTPYDFTIEEHKKKQLEAIAEVRKQLGKEYPNRIGGEEVFTDKKTKSYNPANPSELIGTFQKGGKKEAEQAIQAAVKAFETWQYEPAQVRAEYLRRAAAVARRRRYEINAWMILEAGKNFAEADGDTCEGIDFLEYYANQMEERVHDDSLNYMPGEVNEYFYIPLGVGLCIPPWNFPFAIMVGIATSAIVTGNTVVLKPSSDAPKMAQILVEIFDEVGLPDGVLNYFVASGAEAGDYLVEHPKTRFISFTGSMEVGLRINEKAAKISEGQIWIKRVVAEMGGKDTIIVDSEADVDAAAKGTVQAAFGFQGQKCSACSRAVVDATVYDEFIEKVKAYTEAIESGDPAENYPAGPVINKSAFDSILNYIEIGKKEGRLITGGGKVEGREGYFIKPTVIADIDRDATISQEEIFGPVLAILKAKDYDDALNIANNTIYGLTGAVYSKNRAKLDRAKKEFHVGNLYFNRKCTGAVVNVHPFGGFNMSGTDMKAGGKDYLTYFLQGKSLSEKVGK